MFNRLKTAKNTELSKQNKQEVFRLRNIYYWKYFNTDGIIASFQKTEK